MNFVALLLGLGIERLLTKFFHLREFRWLDPVFDRVTTRLAVSSRAAAVVGVIGLAVVAVLPVALLSFVLAGELFQVPYFLLAVIVLLFSLGPRDLKIEANDYCEAVIANSEEDVQKVAREMLENDPPADPEAHIIAVRRAIFIQANNRVFAVMFWFLLLGPTGAWLFRVIDLLRRRLAYQYLRDADRHSASSVVRVVRSVHGVLAWVPARLLVAGYALAGSYDGAIAGWRDYRVDPEARFYEVTNDVLEAVGAGASGDVAPSGDAPDAVVRVRYAMGLAGRTLWLIWCPAIAILTLTDWLT